jgi:hypothetical protein
MNPHTEISHGDWLRYQRERGGALRSHCALQATQD